MKKFFALFLIFSVIAGVFAPQAAAQTAAQLSWSFDIDFNTGLFSCNIPTGDRAEESMGSMDVFTFGQGSWLRSNALRFIFGYKGEMFEFHTRTLLDPLVNPASSLSDEYSMTGNKSLVTETGRSVNWYDFLRHSFDEYYFLGRTRFFTGYLGNTPNRGKVDDFNTFTDDVLRTVVVEHYGVNLPADDAGFNETGHDANNFMTRPVTEFGVADPYEWVMPYFMLDTRLAMRLGKLVFPVSMQLATDPGQNSGITGSSYKRYNGSVRFSAEKIADLITFDAIYRIRGGDPTVLDTYDPAHNSGGVIQPDGRGTTAHIFGLYTNIHKVPNFGIGLGYTGYLVTYEDDKNTNKLTTRETITTSGPLYSGIDLRLQYTGIEKMTITLNNNVSFATADYSTETAKSIGILGIPLNSFTSQSWFALYNALGLDYQLTDDLALSFQIGNRYGLITTNSSVPGGGYSTAEMTRMQLGGGAFAAYQIRNILVQAGFAFRYLQDSYSDNAPGAQTTAATRDANGGTIDIAIPIRVRYVLQKR